MKKYLCADCGKEMSQFGQTMFVCIPCWVRESTLAQGVPEYVVDPETLRRVAVLLGRMTQ